MRHAMDCKHEFIITGFDQLILLTSCVSKPEIPVTLEYLRYFIFSVSFLPFSLIYSLISLFGNFFLSLFHCLFLLIVNFSPSSFISFLATQSISPFLLSLNVLCNITVFPSWCIQVSQGVRVGLGSEGALDLVVRHGWLRQAHRHMFLFPKRRHHHHQQHPINIRPLIFKLYKMRDMMTRPTVHLIISSSFHSLGECFPPSPFGTLDPYLQFRPKIKQLLTIKRFTTHIFCWYSYLSKCWLKMNIFCAD